jgi:hypothetical protein
MTTETSLRADPHIGWWLGAVVLWVTATGLLIFVPLLFYLSGASDDATDRARSAAARILVALACPAVVLFIGFARRSYRPRTSVLARSSVKRALLLVMFACAVLEIALRVGEGEVWSGDAPWAIYWGVAALGWIVLSVRCAKPSGGA